MVFGLLLFICFFAFSSGPLAWVVISEVFPLLFPHGRARQGRRHRRHRLQLDGKLRGRAGDPVAVGDTEGRGQQQRAGYSFVAFGAVCLFSLAYVHE